MTVTISYTAFLLTILCGAGIAALVYLIIVLVRITSYNVCYTKLLRGDQATDIVGMEAVDILLR